MSDLFRRLSVIFVAVLVGTGAALPTVAQTQNEPPTRVGRLAFTQGTVSFHNSEENAWTPAAINTPLTTGDAIWTEPNARSEISLAGTRVRMEAATQLGMLAVDDSQTRLQLDQGRIDVKTFAFDRDQPYEVVTPRGTVQVLEQGDYYVEAGSTEAPTRLGVRAGAAQIQALNGQVLAVRPGQVGEAVGDPNAPQLRIVENTPPPAPPAYWAARDRQVIYDRQPEYLPAGVTGYEDLNAYGDWTNDGTYGQVWMPRSVPAGWAPYRTGRWVHHPPYGWTWVDEQPWGFAPYHYGRWANTGGRWAWVPPQRDVRPAYAPALVAFVGGAALGSALTTRHAAPVGWFPLGPREAYVPPYTTNRDYYLRLNRAERVEDAMLRERWERAQRREDRRDDRRLVLMNQRHATVVPANSFVRSEPVSRAALRVVPEKMEGVTVARVAAPPARDGDKDARGERLTVAKTRVGDMQTLARPADTERRTDRAAPGPKIAAPQPRTGTDDKSKRTLPPLAPRQGDDRQQARPADEPRGQPGQQPGKPDDAAKPSQQRQEQQQREQQARPAEPRDQQRAPEQRTQPGQQPGRPDDTAKPRETPAPPQQRPEQRQEQQRQQQTRPAEPREQQRAPEPRSQPGQQPGRPGDTAKPRETPAPQQRPEQRQEQQRQQQTRPAEPPRQPQAAPQQQQQRPAPQPQAAPQRQQQQQQQSRPPAPQQQQVPQQAQQPPQQRPQPTQPQAQPQQRQQPQTQQPQQQQRDKK